MSNLLLQPDLSGDGPIHDVTPASAGWSHVGFGLHDLAAGTSVGSDGTRRDLVEHAGAPLKHAGIEIAGNDPHASRQQDKADFVS